MKNLFNWLVGIAIALLAFSSIQECSDKQKSDKKANELVSALNDTVKYYINQQGQQVARIQQIQMESAKAFTDLNLQNNQELVKLQKVVESYKKELKKGGSVTVIEGETKFDTVYVDKKHDGKIVGRDTFMNTIDNKWITLTYGWKKDSTIAQLKTRDEYDIVIGYDKKKPFADVTSHSPYSSVRTVRSFQVEVPKQKKNHIGIGIMYGIGADFKPQPVIGIGYTRSIISF